mmetsp:Transcript_30792/g.65189  ORF Transcript_30792/g.65189 Transcript_30792/m.65189 type:complete len:88 (-) Transcript_30792:978-1241(-)
MPSGECCQKRESPIHFQEVGWTSDFDGRKHSAILEWAFVAQKAPKRARAKKEPPSPVASGTKAPPKLALEALIIPNKMLMKPPMTAE